MEKFVILTTKRTGSTRLVSLLDSHPQIMCMEELLLSADCLKTSPLKYAYSSFRNKNLVSKLRHKFFRERSNRKYLEFVFSEKEYSACGFKVMGSQIRENLNMISILNEMSVKFILLKRKNLLKKLISHKIALTTGEWSRKKSDEYDRIKVKLDKSTLLNGLDNLVRADRNLEKLLTGCQVLTVFYEDTFGKNQTKVLTEILSFLNIKGSAILKSNLMKQNSNQLIDLVENYKEIVEILEPTDYKSFLN